MGDTPAANTRADGELTTSGRNLLAGDSTASCKSRFLTPNSIGEDSTSTALPEGTWILSCDPNTTLPPPALASLCSRSTSASPTPAGSGAAASTRALLRLRSDRNGGSAEQQNCLVSRMEVGLTTDAGPSVASKNPAWGSAVAAAMNGRGEGNKEAAAAEGVEDDEECLGDRAVGVTPAGSAMNPPPCSAPTALLDLLRSIANASLCAQAMPSAHHQSCKKKKRWQLLRELLLRSCFKE
jgi:hypothetical protein